MNQKQNKNLMQLNVGFFFPQSQQKAFYQNYRSTTTFFDSFSWHWFISLSVESFFCISKKASNPLFVFWKLFLSVTGTLDRVFVQIKSHLPKQTVNLFFFAGFYVCWRRPQRYVLLPGRMLHSVCLQVAAAWLGPCCTCWCQWERWWLWWVCISFFFFSKLPDEKMVYLKYFNKVFAAEILILVIIFKTMMAVWSLNCSF